MPVIYVAFVNAQNLCYHYSEEKLKNFIAENNIPIISDEFVQIELLDDVFKRLKETDINVQKELRKSCRKVSDDKIKKQKEDFLERLNSPEPVYVPLLRISTFFQSRGILIWSPSHNNLKGFYSRRPEKYLGEPIETPISIDNYAVSSAQFNYECDRF